MTKEARAAKRPKPAPVPVATRCRSPSLSTKEAREREYDAPEYGEWAEIPGISPLHALASSEGWARVRARGGSRRLGEPTRGYLRKETGRHSVGVNGKNFYVYQLVAAAFLGQRPSDKHSIDHIDNNCGNNAARNLRWATPSEQTLNQDEHRPKSTGKPVEARPKDDEDAEWRWFSSADAAGKELNVNQGNIRDVCNPEKHRKSAGGYVFRWAAARETQENLPAIVGADDARDNRKVERWMEYNTETNQWAEYNPEAEQRAGYNPVLRVSNRGRAWRKQPRGDGWGHKHTPKPARGNEYAHIEIERKTKQFHRVVWEAFNGEVPAGLVADHIREENKGDNALENLQTITQPENAKKAHEHKRMRLLAAAK